MYWPHFAGIHSAEACSSKADSKLCINICLLTYELSRIVRPWISRFGAPLPSFRTQRITAFDTCRGIDSETSSKGARAALGGFQWSSDSPDVNSYPQNRVSSRSRAFFPTGTQVPLTRWKCVPYSRESGQKSREKCEITCSRGLNLFLEWRCGFLSCENRSLVSSNGAGRRTGIARHVRVTKSSALLN